MRKRISLKQPEKNLFDRYLWGVLILFTVLAGIGVIWMVVSWVFQSFNNAPLPDLAQRDPADYSAEAFILPIPPLDPNVIHQAILDQAAVDQQRNPDASPDAPLLPTLPASPTPTATATVTSSPSPSPTSTRLTATPSRTPTVTASPSFTPGPTISFPTATPPFPTNTPRPTREPTDTPPPPPPTATAPPPTNTPPPPPATNTPPPPPTDTPNPYPPPTNPYP